MELQKRFDGTVESTFSPSIRSLAEAVPDGMKSEDAVRLMWCAHPRVEAFIRNAMLETQYEPMRRLYNEHIFDMEAMETFARSVRDNSSHPDQNAVSAAAKLITTPEWYQQYLRTNHWRSGIVPKAKRYFVSCVLCGGCECLQVHHRGYACLGYETMSDVSLLCEEHHTRVHSFLSLYVPRKITAGALKVLTREGMCT